MPGKATFIYSNLLIYRTVIRLLYGRNTSDRYRNVFKIVQELHANSIVELCFGDTKVAALCQRNAINWKGIDISSSFVNKAKLNGFDVIQLDLTKNFNLPTSDLVLIQGSLYHFHDELSSFLLSSTARTGYLLISEPTTNLIDSTKNALVKKLVGRLTSSHLDEQNFRFTSDSLNNELKIWAQKNKFKLYKIGQNFSRDSLYLLANSSASVVTLSESEEIIHN